MVEIQVRTIFEEGWSEIDHQIRYPYDKDNPILTPYLVHFNTLAGNADEMGSYIKFLKEELNRREAEIEKQLDERDEQIRELQKTIEGLEIDKEDKEKLHIVIDNINQRNNSLLQDRAVSLADTAKLNMPLGLTDALNSAAKLNISPGLTDTLNSAAKLNISPGLTDALNSAAKLNISPGITDALNSAAKLNISPGITDSSSNTAKGTEKKPTD